MPYANGSRTKVVMSVDLGAGPQITMPSTPCPGPQPFVPSLKPRMTRKLNSGGLCLGCSALFGAVHAGQPVGSQADITGFSFHAVNLTTAEGGALAFSLPTHLIWRQSSLVQGYGLARAIQKRIEKTTGSWHYDVVEAG